jgi:mannitol/fructose-specific phosphotransferase system IIA component (Ntr-type)
MNTLAELSSEELMVPTLRSRDATGIVFELCERFEAAGRIPDARVLADAVIQRELMASTALSPGWAMPHARLLSSCELSVAVGRCAEPVIWFESNQLIQMVFLFAVPEFAAADYLTVVSAMARFAKEDERVDQLRLASDRKNMLQVIRQIKLRPSRAPSRPLALAR